MNYILKNSLRFRMCSYNWKAGSLCWRERKLNDLLIGSLAGQNTFYYNNDSSKLQVPVSSSFYSTSHKTIIRNMATESIPNMNQNNCLVQSFRLKPNEGLLEGICAYVKKNQIRACHVVSCVGSLQRATLRLAKPKVQEKERIKTRNEFFEIVSLVGTVEWNRDTKKVTKHLHLTVSDENGACWGGHVLSNVNKKPSKITLPLLPVYTTAEIGLLIDNRVQFSRETCNLSGWPELVVKKKVFKKEHKQNKKDLHNASIILLGMGNVGQAVISRLLKSRSMHATSNALSLNIVALCDSTGNIANNHFDPLTIKLIENAVRWKQEGKKFCDYPEKNETDISSFDLSVFSKLKEDLIVVDCTATDHTTKFLISVLNLGGRVILANKKPITGSLKSYDQLTNSQNVGRLWYESTVGAGTPMCAALRRLLSSGDKVKKIEGALSGTLGYVMTGLGKGIPYSQVISQAYKLGYTEPDPRDDLSGLDVARKALIFARTLGWKLEMKDVDIESLYPPNLANLTVDQFMSTLHELDNTYHVKCNRAKEENKVLRYVATIEKNKCSVGLKALDAASPIGSLLGTDNMAAFYTDIYDSKPLVIQGSGAGAQVTAAGVVADIIQTLQGKL